MPIALERSNRIEGTGYVRGISCIPVYESPEVCGVRTEDRRLHPLSTVPVEGRVKAGPGMMAAAAPAEREEDSSSSCSSWIGRNSDCSVVGTAGSDGQDSGEMEVQSRYKGPLDTMDALEESLPIRRGISMFYRGKSKSFTSLQDVSPSSSSVKDLAKPENCFTRKRKNLLAFSTNWDSKHHNDLNNNNSHTTMRSSERGGSISKRPTNSSRSTLSITAAAAAGTSSSESNNNGTKEDHELSSQMLLPPLHPNGRVSPPPPSGVSPPHKCSFSVRSFSMTDLPGTTNSSCSSRDERFY